MTERNFFQRRRATNLCFQPGTAAMRRPLALTAGICAALAATGCSSPVMRPGMAMAAPSMTNVQRPGTPSALAPPVDVFAPTVLDAAGQPVVSASATTTVAPGQTATSGPMAAAPVANWFTEYGKIAGSPSGQPSSPYATSGWQGAPPAVAAVHRPWFQAWGRSEAPSTLSEASAIAPARVGSVASLVPSQRTTVAAVPDGAAPVAVSLNDAFNAPIASAPTGQVAKVGQIAEVNAAAHGGATISAETKDSAKNEIHSEKRSLASRIDAALQSAMDADVSKNAVATDDASQSDKEIIEEDNTVHPEPAPVAADDQVQTVSYVAAVTNSAAEKTLRDAAEADEDASEQDAYEASNGETSINTAVLTLGPDRQMVAENVATEATDDEEATATNDDSADTAQNDSLPSTNSVSNSMWLPRGTSRSVSRLENANSSNENLVEFTHNEHPRDRGAAHGSNLAAQELKDAGASVVWREHRPEKPLTQASKPVSSPRKKKQLGKFPADKKLDQPAA